MSEATHAVKLQIPKGGAIRPVKIQRGFRLEASVSEDSDSVILFAIDSKSFKESVKIVVDAAKRDRLDWVAYPKAGKLGIDLNRDRLQAS